MNTNSSPLVSVLVITYNQKAFIGECVDSVLSQDYADIELVVADDCSTDGTRELLLEYSSRFPGKVKLALAEKNGGITANCNNGLALCTGDYLCLVGGDDIFLPGKITDQVNWFLQNPGGSICAGDVDIFYSDTNKTIELYRNKEFFQKGPIEKIVAQRNAPPTSVIMIDYRKGRDIRFDPRTPVVSDWLFVVEAAMRGEIGYIPKTLIRYRRHAQNITATGIGKSHLDDRLIYTEILLTKYPRFYKQYRLQRANIFYEYAKRLFFEKQYREARRASGWAFKESVFEYRAVALWLLTFGGSVTFDLLNGLRNQKQKKAKASVTMPAEEVS